jgi:DNA-binding GntR family transcriptional regulator
MTDARRKRQYEEIVEALERGDRDRARALAYEHLLEYPDDEAVWQILTRICA